MTVPLIVIFYEQSKTLNTEISSSQIDKVASEIRDAADEVYYLGAPSKKTLTVYMPQDVKTVSISDDRISFFVESADGDYYIVKWSVANLSGSISNFSGIHHVSVEAGETTVQISDS